MDFCDSLVCLSVYPSDHPSVLQCKNCNIGQHAQLYQPNSSIPTMLISTTDVLIVIPISVAVTFAQGQQKALRVGFIFLHISLFIRMKYDVVLMQCKLNIMILQYSNLIKGSNCCFSGCIKPKKKKEKTTTTTTKHKAKQKEKKNKQTKDKLFMLACIQRFIY